MNNVMLQGNLGGEPEVKYIPSGDAVANFSMATREKWKDKSGEWKESTDWHRIVAWRQLAEQAAELGKGDMVQVIGKLKTRAWDDKDGNKRYVTEVVANSIMRLAYLSSTQKRQDGPPVPTDQGEGDGDTPEDDSIPF